MDVVFLGTPARCRPPTVRRPALLVRRGGERLLFDCARGHPAPAAPLVARPDRPARGLPHPLPRRPLPRPARDAEDVRAARPRGADHDLRPARARRPVRRRCGGSSAGSPTAYELEELRPGDTLARDDYRLVTFPVAHGVSSIGYALVEDERPGRFDVETADALGVPVGPERGALQRGEAVTLADGTRRHARAGARRGAARPDDRRSRATPRRRRPSSRLARGADLLVHEATFLEDERDRAAETAHSTARRRSPARPRGGRPSARAHAPLDALLRAGRRPRGTRGLPRDGRSEGLRYHRRPVPGARWAASDQGWRAPATGRSSSDREQRSTIRTAVPEETAR